MCSNISGDGSLRSSANSQSQIQLSECHFKILPFQFPGTCNLSRTPGHNCPWLLENSKEQIFCVSSRCQHWIYLIFCNRSTCECKWNVHQSRFPSLQTRLKTARNFRSLLVTKDFLHCSLNKSFPLGRHTATLMAACLNFLPSIVLIFFMWHHLEATQTIDQWQYWRRAMKSNSWLF